MSLTEEILRITRHPIRFVVHGGAAERVYSVEIHTDERRLICEKNVFKNLFPSFLNFS